MGFPFPLGIRLMERTGLEDDVSWMWGIKGAASVFGSALAVSVSVGYTAALVLGGLVCLSVAFAAHKSGTRPIRAGAR